MAKATTATAIVLLTIGCTSVAYADTFGTGLNVFDIAFVPIGNSHNADDTTGNPNPVGKVEYAYRMGKYEISRDMITKANNEGGLGITLDPLNVFVTASPRDAMPATGISWFEATMFVNWLNTSTGHTPAYKFNAGTFELWQPGDVGYNPANRFRNSRAFYVLPSVDEWYKAAYYDPVAGVYYDYATGSDTAPTPVSSGTASGTAVYQRINPADITLAGGLSPYGTMGQSGNAYEWEETELDLVNDSVSSARGVRGGSWTLNANLLLATFRNNGLPNLGESPGSLNTGGFRVASVVPEPGTMLLVALATGGLLAWRRR